MSFEVNFPVTKYTYVDIVMFYKSPVKFFQFGWNLGFSKKSFRLELMLGFITFYFDTHWNGDHDGFDLKIDTPWLDIIDFEFYDIRHKDDK